MGILDFAYRKEAELPSVWAVRVARSFFDKMFETDGKNLVSPVKAKDSSTGVNVSDNVTAGMNLWKVGTGRKTIYQDIERMDEEDELIASALDITADTATTDGIKVHSDNEEVKKIIDTLFARLNMDSLCWQMARSCAKHGQTYREVVIDRKNNRIVNLKDTVYYQIWPKTNEKGDKVPGWVWKNDEELYTKEGGKELEEWQILEIGFGYKKGLFHISPLSVARKNWNRLAMLEDGMAIARLTRAYDRLVHKIPIDKNMTDKEVFATLQKYKDLMTKKKISGATGLGGQTVGYMDNPFSVSTDFYLPDDGSQRGGVSAINSTNNQLMRLEDVYYHRERILARLGVPISYLQIMSTQKTHLTSGQGVSDAEKQFSRVIKRLQATLRRAIERICDMELLLNGINPVPGMYTLEMTRTTSKDELMEANILLTYSQAAVYFVEAFGWLPPELIADKFFMLTNEQKQMFTKFLEGDAETIKKAKLKKMEMEAEPKPAPTGTGAGNTNKSRAKRSTEQKGKTATKQGFIEEIADVFTDLHLSLAEDVDVNNIPDRNTVFQTVLSKIRDIGLAYDE